MNGPRLLLLAALLALAVPASASAADLVIKVRNEHVSELGAVRANGSHGTLRNAIKAWGKPSTRSSGGGGFCDVSWSTVGVRAVFKAGCGYSSRIQWARLRSKRWTTERGLHVGDPTAKLKQVYPDAKFTVGTFWLYQAYDAFVQGPAPIVTAQMKGGAVDFIRADVNPPK
jgi:opacity protein-like surface antigen